MQDYSTVYLFSHDMKTVLFEKTHAGPETASLRGFTALVTDYSAEPEKAVKEAFVKDICVSIDQTRLMHMGTVSNTLEGPGSVMHFFYGILDPQATDQVDRAIIRQKLDRSPRTLLWIKADDVRHAAIADERYAGQGIHQYFVNQACTDLCIRDSETLAYDLYETHANETSSRPYIKNMTERCARYVSHLLNKAVTDSETAYKAVPTGGTVDFN